MNSYKIRRYKQTVRESISRIHFFKWISITVIIFLCFFFINIYNNSFKPQIANLAESKANYILNNAVNEGVKEVIMAKEITYNELVSVIKDDSGKISGITTNLVAANKLKSDFTIKINEKINSLEETEISIPLGNLTKINTLSGFGPKLKIKLLPSGKLSVNFKNEFKEAGINQTRHEIYLEAVSSASFYLPTGIYSVAEIVSKIPLCESIIVGIVPESLTRLETSDETLRDDILNIY